MSNRKLTNKEKAALAAPSVIGAGAVAYQAYVMNKPSPRKGLKAPTAKTAEKVADRALQRFHSSHGFVMGKKVQSAKNVAARSFNAFERKYPQALAARLNKESANIKKINKKMGKNLVDDLLGKPSIATKLAKITKSVTPAGVVATVMSPTKVADATIHKGFKQKEFKRK